MNHLLWTPAGFANTAREQQVLPPEYLRMLSILADTSAQIDVGLHCSRCGVDLVGQNDHSDSRWMLECGCRTFLGGNPARES